jgi:acetyl esterase/lipase
VGDRRASDPGLGTPDLGPLAATNGRNRIGDCTRRDDMNPRPHLLVRAILTSVGLLLLVVPAAAVIGGYLPRLPTIGGFGRLLVTDLPWLVLGATAGLGLAVTAIRLGGRRFTIALAALGAATLMANLLVGIQFAALAADHDARYDPLRQATSPLAFGRRADERVTFAAVGGVNLRADIWRSLDPSVSVESSGVAPPYLTAGLLFIHGGGFSHGELGLRPRLFALFADGGTTVADVEYRLAPPPRWQDARADVLCALGWFQANARVYGVDPARIVVMGDSAGGNLALHAAYAPSYDDGVGLVQASCDFDPQPPAGVIAVYPTADLVATWEDVKALGDPAPFPESYAGGTPDQVPDRYRDASIEGLIGPALRVPTLIVSGVNDGLVRIDRMRTLLGQLRAAGTDVELVEVPFADHAFDGPANGFGFQLEETILPEFVDRVTRR